MAAPKDYYKVLGVSETASADEIKKSYRKLAKKYHPDVTGGDKAKEARFKEATEAYEVLGEDKKRAAYDEQRRNPGGKGAPAGDLLIGLHEKPHPRFRRRAPGAADIEVDVPVPVEVAILGGKADVPTLEGTTVSLTIPAGTSSGRQLRLRGKGAVISGPGGARGDLFAVASVQVPSEIPPKAKELIEEFA